MSDLILAVDDETKVLSAYQRNLGDRYKILTAESPRVALKMLENEQFSVILSDLRMPEMDGIEFLVAAKLIQPESVRMMISGHADISDAVNSLKAAVIFRLLLKPCPPNELASNLDDALRQYRLIVAERVLLEDTLKGSIKALTEILSMLDPEAFGLAQLRRQLASSLAVKLKQPVWEFEIAALMAEIGRATLPPSINEKLKKNVKLEPSEAALVERLPEFSAQLLSNIPRLEGVVSAVLYQNKHFNGEGFPGIDRARDEIPICARALHAINAMLQLHKQGIPPKECMLVLKMGPEKYDPAIVTALYSCIEGINVFVGHKASVGPRRLTLKDLSPGMHLLGDVVTISGMVVLGAGVQLTAAQIQRLRNFSQINPLQEPILVEVT